MPLVSSPSATLTIAANATSGTITGDMSTYAVQVGMDIFPGSRNGRNGISRILTGWTLNGTTGASFTINEAFVDYSGTSLAFTSKPFVIDNMAVPTSTIAQNSLSLAVVMSALRKFLGVNTTLDQSSKSIYMDRDAGGSTFGRVLWSIAGRLWFGLEHRTVSGAEKLTINAYADGTTPIKALEVDGATGNVKMAGTLSGGTSLALTSGLTVNSAGGAPIGANIKSGSAGIALDLVPDSGTGQSALRFTNVGYTDVLASIYAFSAYIVTVCSLRPDIDNVRVLGNSSFRYNAVYAGSGLITTSDATEKTPVAPMSNAEVAAGAVMAKELGTFQFLASVAEKGDAARHHVGMTVQRAAEILTAHGLDPWRYGFMCHDEWDATPAVPGAPAVAGVKAADDSWETSPQPAVAEIPARPAGDRYSFRPDQLALFIARGQEARLAALEAQFAA